MALYHAATIKPSKTEFLAEWIPTQPWGPSPDLPIEAIGAYRFDDPESRVGMETHIVRSGDALLQVPLTYRDQPLAGAEDAFVTTLEHSALGTRWVYDGLGDAQFVFMLAAVTMTGQGEALGMVVYEGRWHIAPSKVRIQGGGWTGERVPVDNFERVRADESSATLRNDRFEMTVFRRLTSRSRPAMGLTATWHGQSEPVVLAEVVQLDT